MMNKDTRKIILKTQRHIFSEQLGNHPSKLHGEGFEFSELREYAYGDDVRKIDWKTTAKTNTPYIRVYHEERELNIVIATMLGGSTYFGTHRQKRDVIGEIAALIGFSAIRQNDRLSLFLYADKLISFGKPSKQRFSLIRELEIMKDFNMIGRQSDYKNLADTLYRNVTKKSIIYVITDGIGDIDLAKLSKKHEVVIIVVRDRFEEEPKELGFLQLIDMENGMGFLGNIDMNALNGYKKALYVNDLKLYEHSKKYGIKIIKIYTHDDVYLRLLQSL